MYNQVTHIRFDKTEKGIIWDEYDPITDNNSYGILEEIQEDYFSIRIMENGNKSDYGTTQIYKRLTTE